MSCCRVMGEIDGVSLLLISASPERREALRLALAGGLIPGTLAEVSSLEEAELALRARSVDIVFTDAELRDADARQVLALVRQLSPELPVIALTGDGDGLLGYLLMDEGAVDYLPSSHLTSERVDRSIRRALCVLKAQRRASDAARALDDTTKHLQHLSSAHAEVTRCEELDELLTVGARWAHVLAGANSLVVAPGDLGGEVVFMPASDVWPAALLEEVSRAAGPRPVVSVSSTELDRERLWAPLRAAAVAAEAPLGAWLMHRFAGGLAGGGEASGALHLVWSEKKVVTGADLALAGHLATSLEAAFEAFRLRRRLGAGRGALNAAGLATRMLREALTQGDVARALELLGSVELSNVQAQRALGEQRWSRRDEGPAPELEGATRSQSI